MRKIKRSRDLEFPGLPSNTAREGARARIYIHREAESGTKTRKVPGHGARAFGLTSLCHQLASPLMTIAERARALA